MVGAVVGVSGTGIAGLSLVAYARLLGAARVVCVGRRGERTQLALELGATDVALSGSQADALFRDIGGADVVFEASGNAPAIGSAYPWLRAGGRLIIYTRAGSPRPPRRHGCAAKCIPHRGPAPRSGRDGGRCENGRVGGHPA